MWALLTHPDQLALALAAHPVDAGVRGICALDLADRNVPPADRKAMDDPRRRIRTDERVFLMFGSGNRDEKHFERAEAFDIRRDTSKSIAFGAGPHFCAGAWASRAMVADVALPDDIQAFPESPPH